jgi:hypothetical protein
MRVVKIAQILAIIGSLGMTLTSWSDAKEGEMNITVQPTQANSNLVPNSSFEEISDNHLRYWRWDRRNTDATMAIDETIARSGKRSIKIMNGTSFGPHVYGWFGLVDGIPVKPNTTYTISCYVRTEGAGVAWIGGGRGWRVRTRFPRVTTGGRWMRVWRSFTTEPDERTFSLMVVTESPTEGFWIDDVKLEEGDRPTLYIPDFEEPRASIELELPPPRSVEYRGGSLTPVWKPDRYPIHGHAFAGDQLRLEGLLYLPDPVGQARLYALIERTDTGEVMDRAASEADFDAGAYDIEVSWGCADAEIGRYRVRAWLDPVQGGGVIASAEIEFQLYSRNAVLNQIERVRDLLSEFERKLEKLGEAGADTTYPRVTASIVRDFIGYALEDVEGGEIGRAWDAAVTMERMLRDELSHADAALKGEISPPRAVRYVTSHLEINGTSFIGEAQWSDEEGNVHHDRRPVFFLGYGHFGQVRHDIERFPDYGVNIIQIEFGPNSVFPAEGKVENRAVEDFLRVCDRAARANVMVNLLISPHYFPGWALEKYPHLRTCSGGFLKYCVDAPESRDLLERFLRRVIPQIKDHPALHSICLSNEPIYVDSRECRFTLNRWRRWLRERHGDIETLNRRWRTNLKSFDEIEIPKPELEPKPIYYDWAIFNMERFAGWHRWMADIIHEMAPDLPVHAKIMMWMPFGRREVIYGVDPELFGELSQINGNDCVKWYARHGEWANQWLVENMAYDLQCSVADKPIFNSENHLIPDRYFNDIPPEHIRNVLWQGAIHGQGATTIWVWERTFSPTSDFAGSIMHRPNCAVEVGRTCLDLNRLAREVTAIQRLTPQIVLLHSWASIVYSNEHLDALKRAYAAANFVGVKLGFVTERQLRRFLETDERPLPLRDAKLIIVPRVTHTPDATVRALERLARSGVKIVFIGEDLLRRTEYDEPRDSIPFAPAHILPADADEREIWRWLEANIGRLGVRREVMLHDENGDPLWGVEYLTARLGERVLVNICNYTRQPLRVRIHRDGKPVSVLDLIEEKELGRTFTVQPLMPFLVSPR